MLPGTMAGWLLVVVVAGSIEGFRVNTEVECIDLSRRLQAVLEATIPPEVEVSMACLSVEKK